MTPTTPALTSLTHVEELSPAPDPMTVLERFVGQPHLLFLDSAADPQHLGRYSYLTADPQEVFRSRGTVTERRRVPGGWEPVPGDALAAVTRVLAPGARDPVPGLPPFQGGAAGYIGYDWGAVLERVPPTRYNDLALPDLCLGVYDWVIAWDHREHRAWLISTGIPAQGPAGERRARERLEMVLGLLASTPSTQHPSGPPRRVATNPAPSYPVTSVELAERCGIRSTFTHRGYLDAVTRVRDYIVAGDIFQANLSQRFHATATEPPFQLYRRLRRHNPAPFAAYLDFEEVTVMSASPERFLRLDPETRQVETRPIKGTRPRGVGPMHDAALGQALIESEKDRAENVMIVDLLRNDLSRVCGPGTVRAPELFALEHHPTVHHLVSTIVGELEPGRDAADLLRAAFPGGSITGAPKVRAMEIIAELEPTQRAMYCGAIGYLSLTGALDTSIVIRTYLGLGSDLYFQAGGGIVADSDPEQEYRETLDKAMGLMDALDGGRRA